MYSNFLLLVHGYNCASRFFFTSTLHCFTTGKLPNLLWLITPSTLPHTSLPTSCFDASFVRGFTIFSCLEFHCFTSDYSLVHCSPVSSYLMCVLHSSRTEIITSLKFHSSMLHFPRASFSASSPPVSLIHFSSFSLVHIFHCFIRPCLIHCFTSFYFIDSNLRLDHFLISRASLLHFSHPSLLHCSHVHCFTFLI